MPGPRRLQHQNTGCREQVSTSEDTLPLTHRLSPERGERSKTFEQSQHRTLTCCATQEDGLITS
eukprot:811893-Prorocentrum_minimum.AAC.1